MQYRKYKRGKKLKISKNLYNGARNNSDKYNSISLSDDCKVPLEPSPPPQFSGAKKKSKSLFSFSFSYFSYLFQMYLLLCGCLTVNSINTSSRDSTETDDFLFARPVVWWERPIPFVYPFTIKSPNFDYLREQQTPESDVYSANPLNLSCSSNTVIVEKVYNSEISKKNKKNGVYIEKIFSKKEKQELDSIKDFLSSRLSDAIINFVEENYFELSENAKNAIIKACDKHSDNILNAIITMNRWLLEDGFACDPFSYHNKIRRVKHNGNYRNEQWSTELYKYFSIIYESFYRCGHDFVHQLRESHTKKNNLNSKTYVFEGKIFAQGISDFMFEFICKVHNSFNGYIDPSLEHSSLKYMKNRNLSPEWHDIFKQQLKLCSEGEGSPDTLLSLRYESCDFKKDLKLKINHKNIPDDPSNDKNISDDSSNSTITEKQPYHLYLRDSQDIEKDIKYNNIYKSNIVTGIVTMLSTVLGMKILSYARNRISSFCNNKNYNDDHNSLTHIQVDTLDSTRESSLSNVSENKDSNIPTPPTSYIQDPTLDVSNNNLVGILHNSSC